MLEPTHSPKDVLSEIGRYVAPPASSMRNALDPTRMSAPGRTSPSLRRTPSTKVPLVLPQSRTRIDPERTRSSQCTRDTVGSERRSSLPCAVPTRATPSGSATRVPREGPSTTSSATESTRRVGASVATGLVTSSLPNSPALYRGSLTGCRARWSHFEQRGMPVQANTPADCRVAPDGLAVLVICLVVTACVVWLAWDIKKA